MHVEVDALGCQTLTVRLPRCRGCFGVLAVVVLFYALRLVGHSNCCVVGSQCELCQRVEVRNLVLSAKRVWTADSENNEFIEEKN